MPRIYHTSNSVTNTANLPIISLTGSAAVRPSIRELVLGSRTVAADNAAAYALQSTTAAGDRTALTAQVRDSGDPVALSTPRGQAGGTVDPTFVNNFLLISLNQRATFRWIAAPDGEILLPVGTANGCGLRALALSASAFVADATLIWAE